jgi:hypothetical protein
MFSCLLFSCSTPFLVVVVVVVLQDGESVYLSTIFRDAEYFPSKPNEKEKHPSEFQLTLTRNVKELSKLTFDELLSELSQLGDYKTIVALMVEGNFGFDLFMGNSKQPTVLELKYSDKSRPDNAHTEAYKKLAEVVKRFPNPKGSFLPHSSSLSCLLVLFFNRCPRYLRLYA